MKEGLKMALMLRRVSPGSLRQNVDSKGIKGGYSQGRVVAGP